MAGFNDRSVARLDARPSWITWRVSAPCDALCMKARTPVRRGWLLAAVIDGVLSVLIIAGFQMGSCQDSLDPAASSCSQGPEPLALLLGLTGAAFVVFALVRAFRD